MLNAEHGPVAAQMDIPWSVSALIDHNQRAPFAGPVIQAYLGQILEDQAPTGEPIVEIGAGLGYLGMHLPQHLRAYYSQTEISEKNCKVAKEHNPDLQTLAARAQQLPFSAGSIGSVIARNVFDMVSTPQVVQELGRVVQPGGAVIHLRDRRPSLVWMQQHLKVGDSKRFIPYFDQLQAFQRYQVLPLRGLKEFLRTKKTALTPETISDPHYQDYITGGAQKTAELEHLKLLCRLAESWSERVTPPFPEIMDKKLTTWFRAAGFATDTETFTADYEMPMNHALKLGWPKRCNYWESRSDGYYDIGYDEKLPADSANVSHSLDVFVAIKKHRKP